METLKFIMVTTHFPPYHLGGDAVFVKYLSEELADQGHEVHVLHTPSAYQTIRGTEEPAAKEDLDQRVARHAVASSWPRTETLLSLSLGIWKKARRQLDELVRTTRPDVVHWHNTKGSIALPYSIPGAVALYTAHDYYSVCTRSNLLRDKRTPCAEPNQCMLCNLRWHRPMPIWRAMSGRVLPLPEGLRVIAPSEYMAKRLRQDGIRVHGVIRNFVPDRESSPGSGQTGDRLLYIGMLETHKGPQTLLEAFARSRKEQGFKLCIVGQGSLSRKLHQKIRENGLEERVSIPGFISRKNINALRQESLAQIIPSEWFENAPLTALEGFSFGTPLIGSDIGGLPEILTPENGAEVFAHGDPDDLSERLKRLWKDRERLEGRRRLSRKAYDTWFNPKTHIEAYMDALRRD
jgi:glycosyltransferase involved in cell wall biosynthesis